MYPRSRVRAPSTGLLTLGSTAVALGVAKGILLHRPLLESGSSNRVAVLGGFALIGLGLLFRQPKLIAVLRRSQVETPPFLARVQSKPLFQVRLSFWLGVTAGLAESGYR